MSSVMSAFRRCSLTQSRWELLAGTCDDQIVLYGEDVRHCTAPNSSAANVPVFPAISHHF
jgi:hypothetical protein